MTVRNNYIGYLELALAALLPVILSALFAWLLKKTRFAAWRYWVQQVVIGLAFSGLAILATEFGIHIEGASINVRDAAPLAAGLLFGGPAGIIAGVIGGVERWFAAFWGAGMYTRLACSLAAVVAGALGAVLHRSAFRGKRPAWWYMLAIGVGAEALHMLLIIWTHMSDLENAFSVALICSVPMITANGLSLMFSAMAASYIENGRIAKDDDFRTSLQVKLHRGLFWSILAAFIASAAFSVVVEGQLAVEESAQQLDSSLDKVAGQLAQELNSGLEEYTEWIAGFLDAGLDGLAALEAGSSDFPWIYVTDMQGTILSTNVPDAADRNINEYGRAAELLAAAGPYTSPYQPSFFDPAEHRIYVSEELQGAKRLVAGYGAAFLSRELQRRAASGALSRNVGIDGALILLDADGRPTGAEEISPSMLEAVRKEAPGVLGTARDSGGQTVFLMHQDIFLPYGTYIALATLPVSEAVFVSSVMSFLTILTEILIFLALFVHLSYLVRREVVSQIHAVNSSLSRITAGDLDEAVRVDSSSEFVLLSGGINATIDALKRYIEEAANRLDQELEFARTIQRAALPSVFPAFPNRKEFDIYASMEAAREVGGDFYDFYLLGDSTLILVIADVSGKGIPAAMFMMQAKTMLNNFTQSGTDVEETFMKTNDALCANNDAEMFVTAWMGALNLETGRLRYVNAGHNPMLMAKAGSPFAYVKPPAGFVLAGIEDYPYTAHELTMEPGDILYVYTDGATEAQNVAGELYGDDRLRESADRAGSATMKEMCDSIRTDVNQFAGEAEQFDDMTMLAVRVHYLEGPDELRAQPDADSPELIRAFLLRALSGMKVPEAGIEAVQKRALAFWRETVMAAGGRQALLKVQRGQARVILTFGCESRPERGPEQAGHHYEDGWNYWTLQIRF